jgi:hypothetical protein
MAFKREVLGAFDMMASAGGRVRERSAVDGADRDGSGFGFRCRAFYSLAAAVLDPPEEAGAMTEPEALEVLSNFSCLFFSFLVAGMAFLREVEAAFAEGFLLCLSRS